MVASGTRSCGTRGSIVGLVSRLLFYFFFPLFPSTWCGEMVSRIGMTTVCREIEVRISR